MALYPRLINMDGEWKFTYTMNDPNQGQTPPQEKAYDIRMPVPGYWDDYIDRLKYAAFWSRLQI